MCVLLSATGIAGSTAQTASPAAAPAATAARPTAPSASDDIMTLLKATAAAAPNLVRVTTMGTTAAGREMPLVIVGTGITDASAEAIRKLDKIRVWVQAGGRDSGGDDTEAVLSLIRDLAMGRHDFWMTSMVLLLNPVVDADARRAGTSLEGTSSDPARDHVALSSPEAAAFVRLLADYDPHVSIELRMEDGPCSAYDVTYALPLHPSTSEHVTGVLRDDWFPFIAKNLKSKRSMNAFYRGTIEGGEDGCGRRPAGAVASPVPAGRRGGAPAAASGRGASGGRGAAPAAAAPPVPAELPAWAASGHQLALRANYMGVRNRFAIVGVTHARDSAPDRAKAAAYFLEEALSFAWGAAARLKKACQDADAQLLVGRALATSARVLNAGEVEVMMSAPAPVGDGGLAVKRTEVSEIVLMRDRQRFEPGSDETAAAEYYLPLSETAVVAVLKKHGIQLRQLAQPAKGVEQFVVATPAGGTAAPTRLEGQWQPTDSEVPSGSWVVRMNQPLARLAFVLLEPTSEDGLSAHVSLADGKVYAITRRR
jgi:hypothetical protein